MSDAHTLEVVGEHVCVSLGGVKVKELPLEAVIRALDDASDLRPRCGVHPRGVRLWWERRDAVAVALEVPPHARSVRWLADDSKAPFGPEAKYRDAFLPYPEVETPYRPSEIFDKKVVLNEKQAANLVARYDGGILHADSVLGKLFDKLEELGLWDETLIVVTSDHGEALGNRGAYRGHGLSWEEGLRVPLIIKKLRLS